MRKSEASGERHPARPGGSLSPPATNAFHAIPPEIEDFLRRLLRNLPGMAYRCRNDPDWTMEFVSAGCRQLTGFDPWDLVDNKVLSFATLIHPDDRERVWRSVHDAIDRMSPFQLTYRIRRADGREVWVWEQGCAVLGATGVEAIEGFITDITGRDELLERVRDQESQFRALVEQALTGIYIIHGGRFTYVNKRFAEIFGYETQEVLELPGIEELVHPRDREVVRKNLQLRLEGSVDEIRYEFRGLRRGGNELDVEVHGRRIELQGRPAIMGSLHDITHRRRAQRRYHEAQKMEALGRLATGVAHDVNNFLSIIKTTAQLLQLERSEDSDLARDLGGIIAAVERGASLSRQLMHFGSPQSAAPETASVRATVEGFVPILTRLVGQNVRIDTDIDPLLPEIGLAKNHLEEIITNLVINAGHAMPQGGTILIAARHQAEGDAEAVLPARREAHVVLEVTDQGAGVPDDIRRRIFEPYFTTKGRDGTGLGLANVWRIANEAGGGVELESEVGVGSTFRVFVPQARSPGDEQTDDGADTRS